MLNSLGNQAKDFTADALLADGIITKAFNLKRSAEGNYVVLFFYNADGNPTFTNEIIAINSRIHEFTSIGAKVIFISINNVDEYLKWHEILIEGRKIDKLNFTLVADHNKEISFLYGIYSEKTKNASYAIFIVDDKFNISHQSIDLISADKNIDEILCYIKAIQCVNQGDQCCSSEYKDNTLYPTVDGTKNFRDLDIEEACYFNETNEVMVPIDTKKCNITIEITDHSTNAEEHETDHPNDKNITSQVVDMEFANSAKHQHTSL